MENTDIYAIAILEAGLVLFTIFCAFKDHRSRVFDRTAEATAEVTRGDKSMNALYTVYAASIASFLVLIDNAEDLTGHKVILIVLSFTCITYVFYLSSWFRNCIFFPVANRLRKD